MNAEELRRHIDDARSVAMHLKEGRATQHSLNLWDNRKGKAEAIFALCMEVARRQGEAVEDAQEIVKQISRVVEWQQLAGNLAGASMKRIGTLDALLVAYRLGKHPTEKVLTAAPGTEAQWQAAIADYDAMMKEQGE